jgi:hypothetical protein
MRLMSSSRLALVTFGAVAISSPSLAGRAAPSFEEANVLNYADRIGLERPSAMPETGRYDISLEISPAADDRVINSGRLCAGFAPPKTMITSFAERIGSNLDVDRNLDTIASNAPRITIRINDSVTIQRCVMISEYSSACYVTTRISGELEHRASSEQLITTPIQSEVTREIKEGLICPAIFKFPDKNQRQYLKWAAKNGGETIAVALVNREAVIGFFANASSKIRQVETAGR